MKYIIRRLKKLRQDRSAFTLIEMLLVLLIVAILMAIIIPNVSGQRKELMRKRRKIFVKSSQLKLIRINLLKKIPM